MRILGIDPGLNVTGYGVVEVTSSGKISLIEAGIIKTSSKSKISERLSTIYNGLDLLIENKKPEVLVLEKIYSHYKHPATAILMGHARGVICVLCGLKNIKLINYPSTRIKKAITGSGHASKTQIQRMITEILHLKKNPDPVDVTDALALAIGFVNIELKNFKKAIGKNYAFKN